MQITDNWYCCVSS